MLRAARQGLARRGFNNASRARRPCDGAPDVVQNKSHATKPLRASAPPKGDGISVEVEYSGLWGAITTFPKRRPFATNCIVATVKTSIADLVVQKAEGKKDIDWQRNGAFTAFGFLYLGIAQWFVYVTVFTRVCPNAIRFSNLSWAEKLKDRAGQIDLIKQTALDNFVHYTFIYYPVFYCIKEAMGEMAGTVKPEEKEKALPVRAMEKYKNNCVQDNMAMWALWIPMDLAIYAVPIWMRLPLNHGVSLVWTMILSSMRGSEK